MDNKQIYDILSFYNCPCEIVGTRQLSVYTDYILNPENGTTIKRLQARAADFSLMIGAAVQVVIDNGLLVLRVETGKQQTLDYFKYSINLNRGGGFIALGLNAAGEYKQDNIFSMPHLLVAGATGSGKSVFLHNAIISLATGGGVCFRMIDLKRVELSVYNGCNFLAGNVITGAAGADTALQFEVEEMQRRYSLMERHNVRNYSQLPDKHKLLARIIVIDELADLMLNRDTRKSVENSIVRIAQLGRAAGIHLILATQRPSREVITGLIKANIPAKIAFKTSTPIDSRVIGITGAESLRGRGDCIYSGGGCDTPERLQAFYISDDQLHDFVKQVKQKQPVKHKSIFKRLFG